MARRDVSPETFFGSDSFLDIVANMVGILIILIVIAGLRVSRAPVALPRDTADANGVPPGIQVDLPADGFAPETTAPQVPDEPADNVAESDRAPALAESAVAPGPQLPPAPPEPPPELVARAGELRALIVETTAAIERSQQNDVRQGEDGAAKQQELTALLADVERERVALQTEQRRAADAGAALDDAKRRLAAATAELEAAQAAPARTQVLKHRVTAIGHVVDGDEVHFRIEGNRVSVVPIDALARELKARVENNRDALLKLQRYEGTIGPTEGYRMHYLIERRHVSVLEELRYGRGFVRMGVAFWELEPQPGAVTESADEAFARGSRFRQALDSASPTATLTLWVYPDSFELCRRLTEHVRSAGFEVASRPLPFGVPIAGSPDGSKSVAQ